VTKTATQSKLRQKHGQDSREVILEVALKLFTKKGYEGTSIDEIREAAGFKSKASLYNHFDSKEEIANALTTRILAQIEQVILTAYQSTASDPLAQFLAVFRAYIQWGLTHRQEFAFRIIKAQESRMLTGQYDFLSTHPSLIFPLIDKIVKQLRSQKYPVRPIADAALFHMLIGAIARSVIDQDAFGEIGISEQVEQVLQVCVGILFSKPLKDFS
jgi:AcrR family transcriptional regulator